MNWKTYKTMQCVQLARLTITEDDRTKEAMGAVVYVFRSEPLPRLT